LIKDRGILFNPLPKEGRGILFFPLPLGKRINVRGKSGIKENITY